MGKKARWLDKNLPGEERVKLLLGEMTREEKIAQLGSVPLGELLEEGKLSGEKMEKFLKKGIGQISRAAGGVKGMEPEEAARLIGEIQKFLKEKTRLKIPALIHEECLAGFLCNRATSFPQAIGMASSWNPTLVQKITARIRRQLKRIGAHQGLSPVLDVSLDPRWGRTEETFGEDPYLCASMGVAYIKGLQAKELKNGIIATGKHFAAHGFPEGGRNCAPVWVGERILREIFLFPFEAAIKEGGLYSIMPAYHEIDGIPCSASKRLLTQILREEWGFEGIVVSDYEAIERLKTSHFISSTEKEAAKLALEAGVDIELPQSCCYGTPLEEGIKEGLISEEGLNRAVSRILKLKFEACLFDEDLKVEPEKVRFCLDTPQDRKLAFQVALESMILLKNEEKLLPLRKNLNSIAVIGPGADNPRLFFGDYTYTSHLSFKKPTVPSLSILEAIKEKCSPHTQILYAQGCEIGGSSKKGFKKAIEVAKKSEVVVLVVGESSGLSPSDTTGEGRDSHNLKLPGVQEDLVKEIVKTQKPVVIILVNGRPLDLSSFSENVGAILEAWLPGEEGGRAVAEVLFGDYNPGGKLPISFPRASGQIPLYYHRKSSSLRDYVFLDCEPLFPFGYGLSYTDFEYSNLKIEPETIKPGESILVSIELKNKGRVKGDEVVQLYLKDVVAQITRPLRQLKGFKRVTLQPGEKVKIVFKIPSEILSFYNEKMELIIEPGIFEVMVGSSSKDIKAKGKFEIRGKVKIVSQRKKFFSEVKVFSS